MKTSIKTDLKEIYQRLFRKFGPQYWWPGRTKCEIIVGAVLTQNTNWGNVEKALVNLRKERLLTLPRLHSVSHQKLARLIKPSGYFNIKAKRLKNLIRFIFVEYKGNLQNMEKEPLARLRKKLLSVIGVGPETADSILLYAFRKPTFVVDAYTKRIFFRHNLIKENAGYHDLQELFMRHLPRKQKMFNEYHALLVRLGKEICKPNPSCEVCPLNDVRYSLRYKCPVCHKALLSKQAQKSLASFSRSSGRPCPECHKPFK